MLGNTLSTKFRKNCIRFIIFLEEELKNNDWIKWTKLLKNANLSDSLPKSNKTLIKIRKYLEEPHYPLPSFLEINDRNNRGGRKYDQRIRINPKIYDQAIDFFRDFFPSELKRILNFEWEEYLKLQYDNLERWIKKCVERWDADKWKSSIITYNDLILDNVMGELEKKINKVRKVMNYFFHNAQEDFNLWLFNKKYDSLKYFYEKEGREGIEKIFLNYDINEIDEELLKRTNKEKLDFCIGLWIERDDALEKFLRRILYWLHTCIELVFHNTSLITDYDFKFFASGEMDLDGENKIKVSDSLIYNFHHVAFLMQEFKENI